MKSLALTAALFLCMHPPWAGAGESEFRIGPRAGPGQIRIHAGQRIGNELVDDTVAEDTVGVGGTFEYRAPFGVVLEAGLFSGGSRDWFDDPDYRLTEYFGSIGYQIELGRGFSLIPRVGRSRWKLEADDSWFFDSDEVNPTARGYENYWEITAFKRLNERVVLGVSHKQHDYDFGRSRSTVFTAMFNL